MAQEKIYEKINKLLALQTSKGATEAEAALAAEHVQRMLQEHNLTLSQVESFGGKSDQSADVKRSKQTTEFRAMYEWHRSLMTSLAQNNFCLYLTQKIVNDKPLYSGGRGKTSRVHVLVGRDINVMVTMQTYEYLVTTLGRLADEGGYTGKSTRDRIRFQEGATERLTARLYERRRAREAEDRAKQPQGAANGTGQELVLADVYGSEADLNNDILNNYPLGTTATRAREMNARNAKRQMEEDRLVEEGVDRIEAFYRAYGYTVESAKTAASEYKKSSSRRVGRGRTQDWTRADQADYEKRNSSSYQAGQEAGKNIGLDAQVNASTRKSITNR
jgi:hypothetical protein